MSDIDRDKADIKNFFKLSLLDIRALAEEKEDLTVTQYFENVDRFILDAPQLVIDINHLRIVRSDIFFLNSLKSFDEITEDIDTFFLDRLKSFKRVIGNIGARGLLYLIEDAEQQFNSSELNMRNALLLRICVDINDIHNRLKRIYTVRKAKTGTPIVVEKKVDKGHVRLIEVLKELESEERTRKLKIVVVDDMPVVLNSVIGILNKHYEVFAFTRPEQMLKFLTNNSADLFLLDIEMPQMNGYELFHAIKEMDVHNNTPIIFMTGQVKSEYVETAIDIGASDFIIKPLDDHTLLKKIWNNVERKKYL